MENQSSFNTIKEQLDSGMLWFSNNLLIALLISSIWSVTHFSAISCGLKQDTHVLFYKYFISNIPSSVNFDKCTCLHTNGFICFIETKPNVTLEPND